MGLQQRIFGVVAYFLMERPGNKKSYDEFREALEEGRQTIQQRIASAADNEFNRDKLSHIIGIERWGQRRLEVALGKPMVNDEHDGYRPDVNTALNAQSTAFEETRQRTMELAKELAEKNVSRDFKVLHNGFGPLTTRGWLQYLNFHANQEAKGIK